MLVWLRRIASGSLLLSVMLASSFAHAKPQPAITVFAASSLQESLDAVVAAWTRQSGQRVVVAYAASSALARQIEAGAPADVFVSADREWMAYLRTRQLVADDSVFDLVANRLVLIVPAASALESIALDQPAAWLQVLADQRLAVAETASVPAGRYARQALTALGVWDMLVPRLAQADNVRAAMAYVARGEAPLGIVYATDAAAEPRVRVLAEFAAASHDRIVYPVAAVAAAERGASAAFMRFLREDEARAIFARAGFSRP
jgi:molybdate transport system substrate-binding protein